MFYVLLMDVVLEGWVDVVMHAFLCFELCAVRWQQRRLGPGTCQPAFASCGLRGGCGGIRYDLVGIFDNVNTTINFRRWLFDLAMRQGKRGRNVGILKVSCC